MTRENWNSFLEGFEKGVARGVFAAVLIFILLALVGCGGGDPEDDDRASTQPVNCQATPGACK